MDGADARAVWDFSYAESTGINRKAPPKRSLDGAPSRVSLELDWASPHRWGGKIVLRYSLLILWHLNG